MIELYDRMPLPLQRAKMMREQLGFALNREGRFEEAEKVLDEVIAEFGPSSETNGLLGRIYKDRWDVAKKEGLPEARALLKNADRHLSGRLRGRLARRLSRRQRGDLMEMMTQARPAPGRDPAGGALCRLAQGGQEAPDYWDYATLLELAVLARDEDDADDRLGEALAVARAPWELETTARNLGLIRDMREGSGEEVPWIKRLEDTLKQRASRLEGDKTLS